MTHHILGILLIAAIVWFVAMGLLAFYLSKLAKHRNSLWRDKGGF